MKVQMKRHLRCVLPRQIRYTKMKIDLILDAPRSFQ